MLTGEFIDGAEGHRIGLVNRLVPLGEEEAEAERLARVVMSRAPLAVINHKRLLQQGTEADFETALNLEKTNHHQPDLHRGLRRSHHRLRRKTQAGLQGTLESFGHGAPGRDPPFPTPVLSRTWPTVLAKRAARSPDKPWIVTEERSYSYAEVDRRSGCMARALAEAGIKSGETVLLMLPDVIEFIWSWCALAKLGAIEVPVNLHYRGSILAYIIKDSGAKCMIAHADHLDRLEEVADQLDSLERIYVLGLGDAKSDKFELLDFPGPPRRHGPLGTVRPRGTAISWRSCTPQAPPGRRRARP